MKREIKETVCDECGKKVQQAEAIIGGSPLHGWFSVKRVDGRITSHRSDNNWDFCSKDCMLKKITDA